MNQWGNDAVFYQIYPLGLCGAPFRNENTDVQHRILQLLAWREHFQKMGINAVLFNPIFESSTHGYDSVDLTKIDRRLGDNNDFSQLCAAFHASGIRIVLDAVFNHVGRDFWAFQDVCEKKQASPYSEWFFIHWEGDSAYQDGFVYDNWEGHNELVRLNVLHPSVMEYLFACVDQWKREFDIDGLRLDVAYCLPQEFIRQLRNHCDKKYSDFFLLGEMIHGDYRAIAGPDLLDAVTNYVCYKGLYSSFNDQNFFEIQYSLEQQSGHGRMYDAIQLFTFADNHDVTRIASVLKEKKNLPALYAMLFCQPGIPCIYYGSEWGVEGMKIHGQPDMDLRPAVSIPVWNDLTEQIALIAQVYHRSNALHIGSFESRLFLTNRQYVFSRRWEDERVLCAFNCDSVECIIPALDGIAQAEDLLSGETVTMEDGLRLLPFEYRILRVC